MSLYIILTIILLFYIYKSILRPYNHWKLKKIKFLKPKPFLGNVEIFNSISFTELLQQMYNKFPNDRYFGLYQFLTPTLMLRDPKLIKRISVKDFDSFMDHSPFSNEEIDPLWNKNLLQMSGEKWKSMRNALSPTFTSSKIRSMFVLMEMCAKQVIQHIKDQKQLIYETETKAFFSRYASDVIATCAFGLNCNSLKEQENELFLMGKKAADFTGLRSLIFFVNRISKTLVKLIRLKVIPTDVENYFSAIIKNTLKQRREKEIVRQDMINLLLEAQRGHNRSSNEATGIITDDDITAQALVFFLGGFMSTTTLISFLAYELAVNQDIQTKLIQEIEENCNEEITYETITKLKYLDMVVSETLRKWPPFNMTDRKVSKDITIEAELDGESPLVLEKDSICWIPIYAIHRDPKYYPNPDKFDPERFSGNFDSSTYMPFGMGPRICIGARFAIIETKLLVTHILKSFEIIPIKKTKIPIVIDPNDFQLSCKGGIWLGFRQRNLTV